LWENESPFAVLRPTDPPFVVIFVIACNDAIMIFLLTFIYVWTLFSSKETTLQEFSWYRDKRINLSSSKVLQN
jgi:hypothetical protein